jgi:hypothetical protein
MRRVHGGAGGCPVGPSGSYTYDEGNTETTQNIQRRGKLPKTVMISQDVTFRQARITDTQESSIGGTWVGEPSRSARDGTVLRKTEKGKGDATGHRMVNQTDSALWRWFWGRSGTQAEKVGIHTCGEMDLQG